MILSPAKTMDFRPLGSASPAAQDVVSDLLLGAAAADDKTKEKSRGGVGCDPSRTLAVARSMKRRTRQELGKLLGGLSPKLSETAFEYWQSFDAGSGGETVASADGARGGGGAVEDIGEKPTTVKKSCAFAFTGPAYQGLNPSTCGRDELAYLQGNLRIVDAAYGLLRPLDEIQPYRLEMGTKVQLWEHEATGDGGSNKKNKKKSPAEKLSSFWSDAVTKALKEELESRCSTAAEEPALLLNLASDEYSSTVDVDDLTSSPGKKVRWVKATFLEQGRVVSVHAKRARGLMARYLAKVNAQTLDDIKAFDKEGYKYDESRSSASPHEVSCLLVFDRPKNWKEANRDAGAPKKRSSSCSSSGKSNKRVSPASATTRKARPRR